MTIFSDSVDVADLFFTGGIVKAYTKILKYFW